MKGTTERTVPLRTHSIYAREPFLAMPVKARIEAQLHYSLRGQ